MKSLHIALLIAAVALAGCNRSVEEICAESDRLLKETTGSGFANSGWRGCLSQTAAEAEMDLKAHRASLEKSDIERVTRSELEKELNGQPIAVWIERLGPPSFFNFNAREKDKSLVSNGYPFATSNRQAGVDEFINALNSNESGFYSMTWVGPFSENAIGMDDAQVEMLAVIYNGKVQRAPFAGFPQNWVDRLSPFSSD